ncbi:hypothetical protein J6590_039409 [Homalodisca vitripennis]|nr:hypothetical protein J6590_039409 [Homalodisca vitripennis]
MNVQLKSNHNLSALGTQLNCVPGPSLQITASALVRSFAFLRNRLTAFSVVSITSSSVSFRVSLFTHCLYRHFPDLSLQITASALVRSFAFLRNRLTAFSVVSITSSSVSFRVSLFTHCLFRHFPDLSLQITASALVRSFAFLRNRLTAFSVVSITSSSVSFRVSLFTHCLFRHFPDLSLQITASALVRSFAFLRNRLTAFSVVSITSSSVSFRVSLFTHCLYRHFPDLSLQITASALVRSFAFLRNRLTAFSVVSITSSSVSFRVSLFTHCLFRHFPDLSLQITASALVRSFAFLRNRLTAFSVVSITSSSVSFRVSLFTHCLFRHFPDLSLQITASALVRSFAFLRNRLTAFSVVSITSSSVSFRVSLFTHCLFRHFPDLSLQITASALVRSFAFLRNRLTAFSVVSITSSSVSFRVSLFTHCLFRHFPDLSLQITASALVRSFAFLRNRLTAFSVVSITSSSVSFRVSLFTHCLFRHFPDLCLQITASALVRSFAFLRNRLTAFSVVSITSSSVSFRVSLFTHCLFRHFPDLSLQITASALVRSFAFLRNRLTAFSVVSITSSSVSFRVSLFTHCLFRHFPDLSLQITASALVRSFAFLRNRLTAFSVVSITSSSVSSRVSLFTHCLFRHFPDLSLQITASALVRSFAFLR